MAKKTVTSASQKAQYGSYEGSQKWKQNRERKLKRHIEANPEDKIAQTALSQLDRQTKPRRAGYKSHRVVVNGVVVKASDRLFRELNRVVNAAARADSYNKKKLEVKTEKPVKQPKNTMKAK